MAKAWIVQPWDVTAAGRQTEIWIPQHYWWKPELEWNWVD